LTDNFKKKICKGNVEGGAGRIVGKGERHLKNEVDLGSGKSQGGVHRREVERKDPAHRGGKEKKTFGGLGVEGNLGKKLSFVPTYTL